MKKALAAVGGVVLIVVGYAQRNRVAVAVKGAGSKAKKVVEARKGNKK